MTTDKKYHILAGFLVAALVALPAYLESGNLFAGLWSALTATAIAGGVKEWADNVYGTGADWRDYLATVLGAVAVAVFIVALHFARG